ncbi:TioE family transcriptional regulator [Planococcus sp. YIM B11945]|uniref:TioE family transcriptional regulator n=1 Tax=Planococcus sp. YIM B11945 TaxID=3435410 RepID=UPI003D7D7F52
MKSYKPIEIARELNISTSALRHYESWGVVPKPLRAENGYRLYSPIHLAYFRCLRAMFPGFGYKTTCEVLIQLQKGEFDAAFWLVSEEQAKLQHEKEVADQTLVLLQDPNLPLIANKKLKSQLTIGEAAKFTDVPASAIRHWEKEGLLNPVRDPENGYRLFTPLHIRQILLIRTLRRTVYFLDSMREIVQAVGTQNIDKVRNLAEDALKSIHERNRQQFIGVHQLVELCAELGFMKK